MIHAQCMYVWRYHCKSHQLLKCVFIIIIKPQKSNELKIHFPWKCSQLLMILEELDLNDVILFTSSLQYLCLHKCLFLSSKITVPKQCEGYFTLNSNPQQILTDTFYFKVKNTLSFTKQQISVQDPEFRSPIPMSSPSSPVAGLGQRKGSP